MRGLVVVVNYDQALEIERFLTRLRAHAARGLDAVLVDDGSTDGSPELAEAMGVAVLRHGTNRGVGAAIRTGIDHAVAHDYDFVVIMSSNGKMRPEELPAITAPITEGNADYVQGSRFLKADPGGDLPRFRRFAIPIATWIANRLTAHDNTDITCGYRAYRLDIFESPQINLHQSWLNQYELEHYIHFWVCRQKLRIVEVSVTIEYGHLGKGRLSKIRPVLDWWSIMRPFFLLAAGVRR